MSNGEGTRGADGVWRPDQAREWLAFTIGYDAAAYGRDLPIATERYTLTAAKPTDRNVLLNRTALRLGGDDTLPVMAGEATSVGSVAFAPVSITFLAAPSAQNPSYE